VIGWVPSLPGPSAVVYEARPTGFGLSAARDRLDEAIEAIAASSQFDRIRLGC